MITGFIQLAGKWLAIAAGAIAAMLMVRKGAADKARLSEQLAQAKRESEKQLAKMEANATRTEEVTRNAIETKTTVSGLSTADVDQRLRDKWDG